MTIDPIHSSTETSRMLDSRELVSELRQLNNRLACLQKENHRMARVLSKWDINGQPGTAEGQTITTDAAT